MLLPPYSGSEKIATLRPTHQLRRPSLAPFLMHIRCRWNDFNRLRALSVNRPCPICLPYTASQLVPNREVKGPNTSNSLKRAGYPRCVDPGNGHHSHGPRTSQALHTISHPLQGAARWLHEARAGGVAGARRCASSFYRVSPISCNPQATASKHHSFSIHTSVTLLCVLCTENCAS